MSERYRHIATGSVVILDDGVGAALGDGFERVTDAPAETDEEPTPAQVRRPRARKNDD